MQAPSQPTPRALHALSVKIDPSRVGMSDVAPCFIRPRAVTKAPRPMAPSTVRSHHGRPAPPTSASGIGTWWYGPGPAPVIRDSGGASSPRGGSCGGPMFFDRDSRESPARPARQTDQPVWDQVRIGRVSPSTTARSAFADRDRDFRRSTARSGLSVTTVTSSAIPLTLTGACAVLRDPLGQLEVVGGREERARLGDVAQPRRQVDRPADVVVALQQDHVPGRHPAAQLELAGAMVALLDGERGPDERLGLDADEHQPVAEPLLDAHPEEGSDLPNGGAERLQLRDRAVVAVLVDEVGEAAQIDERERAANSVIGGDGGQLGGVQRGAPGWRVPPLDVTGTPLRADCDNVHMLFTRAR